MPDLKPTDRVTFRAVDMESIPRGANPFHYDFSSMGTTLTRGWTVMHDGFDRADSQFPLRNIYLYNERSGQRVRLEVHPEVPQTAAECLERVQQLTAEVGTLLEHLQKLVDQEQVA